MTYKRHVPYCLAVCFALSLLSGCATAPRVSGPDFMAGGNFSQLIPLCQNLKMSWEYDPVSRHIDVYFNNRVVKMVVGSSWVNVDCQPKKVSSPVRAENGIVYVSKDIRDILESLAKEPAPLPEKRIKRIVLDAGHGGKDPGAISRSGSREKHINLDIVHRLKNKLKEAGFEVVLTRSDDVFVSLPRRSAIANNSRADLFVSVHANASRSRYLKGFEVYYITPRIDDTSRAYSNVREGGDGPKGEISGASSALKATLWDLCYTRNRSDSVELARLIAEEAHRILGVKILGVKGAKFLVLKNTNIPAVLVEVGFISNRDEERRLKNPYYRQQVADSIAGGIINFSRRVCY